MVSFFGDYDTTETVHIPFNTFSSDDPSASVTVTNLVAGDVEIHKDGGATQRASDAGVTVSIDFDTVTGNHMVAIDLSDNTDAGFYATGSRYQVRVEGTTIDGATINAWIGAFSIGCTIRPADIANLHLAIADAVWDEATSGHAVVGSAGRALTDIEADATAILADTNELQTDDIPAAIAALNDPTAAAIADAVWDEATADHATAGTTGEMLTDIDAEVALIGPAIHNIAVTGTALSVIATASTLTTGALQANTWESTSLNDNVRHTVGVTGTTIDLMYEFNIGGTGVPVNMILNAHLYDPVPGVGSGINLYAYNWGNAAYEVVHANVLSPVTSESDVDTSANLFAQHVGTGIYEGLVRLRFYSTTLDTDASLRVDQIFVEYAESVSANITAILADTDELQTDDIPGLIAALNNVSAAEVNAEIVDALTADTYSEPGQAAPPSTPTFEQMIHYLYKAWRNKTISSGSYVSLYDDSGLTVDQVADLSDSGTAFTRGEYYAGGGIG